MFSPGPRVEQKLVLLARSRNYRMFWRARSGPHAAQKECKNSAGRWYAGNWHCCFRSQMLGRLVWRARGRARLRTQQPTCPQVATNGSGCSPYNPFPRSLAVGSAIDEVFHGVRAAAKIDSLWGDSYRCGAIGKRGHRHTRECIGQD